MLYRHLSRSEKEGTFNVHISLADVQNAQSNIIVRFILVPLHRFTVLHPDELNCTPVAS